MSCGFRRQPFGARLIAPIGATLFTLAVIAARPAFQPSCSLPPLTGADTLRRFTEGVVLRGTTGDDRLTGGPGDDRISGGDGADALRGLAGRDLIDGGAGNDVVEGGDDDDVLTGGDGRDYVFGERGFDRLDGGAGPDVLDGGPGDDDLRGGDDDDRLEGCDGDDVLFGGRGNDVLDGSDGFDVLDGGDGNDNLDGGDDNDILRGGAGVDSLRGSDGADELDGGIDNDWLDGGDGNDVLRGSAGNDAIAGGDGNDLLDGDAGNDVLSAGEGDDVLTGGAGVDTLIGGPGRDRLSGGLGNDALRGDAGDDLLDGDAGDDRLIGGAGTDVVGGGDGNDVIVLRAGDVDSARIEMIDGGMNADTARAESDSLLLNGFAQSDVRPLQSAGPPGFEIVDPLTGGTYIVLRVERIVFVHPVAHIAAGETVLQLVNGSADQLSGRIEFADSAGRPLPLSLAGDSARSVHALRVPAFGRVDFAVRSPRTGSAMVYADRLLALVVGTGSTGGDRVLIAPGTLTDGLQVPVIIDRQNGLTGGATIFNGAGATSLLVHLHSAAGAELESREVDVSALGQATFTARDLFPRFDRMDGKLVIEGAQIAALAFQVQDGRAGTSRSMRWSPRGGSGPRRVPRVVNGDGVRTRLIVAGVAPDSAKGGKVAFFDQAGKPVAVDLVGIGRVTEVPFTIDDAASLFLTTTGQGPAVEASALITSASGVVDVMGWLSPGRDAAWFDVPSTSGYSGFLAPLRRSAAEGVTTHVTIAGGPAATTVELSLRDASGARIAGGDARVSLPPNGHIAAPLERLFPRANLALFNGSITASASGGLIAAALTETGRQSAQSIPVTRNR